MQARKQNRLSGVYELRVTYFQRCPIDRFFSVERLFTSIRNALPAQVQWRVAVSRYPSTGIARRLYNIVEAALRQDEISHVAGDVHFLVYFMRRKRTVLTILDCVSLNRLSGWRRRALKFFWYTLPVRRSASVVAISEFTKHELVGQLSCPPGKIRVIHVPLGSGFSPCPKPFNSRRPAILQIGTTENKNLERCAAALRGVPCVLRIVGPLSPPQRELLARNGIEYTACAGLSDCEIVAEFRACDIVLFASTYEGFGMPVVEGQATGRPVVAGNVCSMPEVSGGAACLVDPFDPESIRAGILKVIDDSDYRESLIRRGYENVPRFDPAAIASQYVEVYRDLLRGAQ